MLFIFIAILSNFGSSFNSKDAIGILFILYCSDVMIFFWLNRWFFIDDSIWPIQSIDAFPLDFQIIIVEFCISKFIWLAGWQKDRSLYWIYHNFLFYCYDSQYVKSIIEDLNCRCSCEIDQYWVFDHIWLILSCLFGSTLLYFKVDPNW